MWAWAIIEEATGKVVEEGFVREEGARRVAEEMGEGYTVELIPM